MNENQKRSSVAENARSYPDIMDANSEIGAKLRALYSAVQEEPIPEKFLDLLEKLDATERKTTNKSLDV